LCLSLPPNGQQRSSAFPFLPLIKEMPFSLGQLPGADQVPPLLPLFFFLRTLHALLPSHELDNCAGLLFLARVVPFSYPLCTNAEEPPFICDRDDRARRRVPPLSKGNAYRGGIVGFLSFFYPSTRPRRLSSFSFPRARIPLGSFACRSGSPSLRVLFFFRGIAPFFFFPENESVSFSSLGHQPRG